MEEANSDGDDRHSDEDVNSADVSCCSVFLQCSNWTAYITSSSLSFLHYCFCFLDDSTSPFPCENQNYLQPHGTFRKFFFFFEESIHLWLTVSEGESMTTKMRSIAAGR